MKDAGKTADQVSRDMTYGTKRKDTSDPWTVETERLVTTVYARMVDLYGHGLCMAKGLRIFTDDRQLIHSREYLLWCKQCNGLTKKQVTLGLSTLVNRAKIAGREGIDFYPPSCWEFIGMCTASPETKAHKPYVPEVSQLDNITGKEAAAEAGKAALAEMKRTMGMPEQEVGDE